MNKKLYKSKTDRKLCGVCGGVAEYLGCDSTLVRILAVVLGIGSVGTAAVIYLAASILMPEEI